MFTAFGFASSVAAACFEIYESMHAINAYWRLPRLPCIWTDTSLQLVFQKGDSLGIESTKEKEFTHILRSYPSDSPSAPLQGLFYFIQFLQVIGTPAH